MIFGYELDVYGFVGMIMLVGIVKKNAIMMIDFALEAERRENKSAGTRSWMRRGAVPADHDDDDGRIDGDTADRARQGRGRRAAGRSASPSWADSPSRSWSRCT